MLHVAEYVQVVKSEQIKETVITQVGWALPLGEETGHVVACGVPQYSAWGGHISDRTIPFFSSVSWLTRKGRVGGPACGTHHSVQVLVVIGADGLAIQQYTATLQRVEVLQDVHTGAFSAA